jgi:crotonobetainyl-CoA:carnitine CoA-transferase CaiB-like acyl-CoA transferase
LIYCAINGFGVNSAYPGRAALDTIIQAMSGLMDVTRPHGKPTKAGISASDNFGGQFGFLAISAALELRDRTGTANHFDLSMQEITLWATQSEWNSFRSPRPTILQASDGYVAVEGSRTSVLHALNLSDADDTLSHLTRDVIVAALPHGMLGQPVLTAAEVFKHPQTKARELLVECPTPQGDIWVVFSQPFKFVSTPTPVTRVMGRLGGTDEEIRAEFAHSRPVAYSHS